MSVLNRAPDSMFAFVVIAGKRARQLMSGAPPLVATPRSQKPTRIAMEELSADRLEYSLPEKFDEAAEKEAKRRRE